MGKKRRGAEEIIGKLRKVEVQMAKGTTTAEASKAIDDEA